MSCCKANLQHGIIVDASKASRLVCRTHFAARFSLSSWWNGLVVTRCEALVMWEAICARAWNYEVAGPQIMIHLCRTQNRCFRVAWRNVSNTRVNVQIYFLEKSDDNKVMGDVSRLYQQCSPIFVFSCCVPVSKLSHLIIHHCEVLWHLWG